MIARRATLLVVLLGAGGARAGAWTLAPGELWIKSAAIYSFTDEQFAAHGATLPDGRAVAAGDRRPFDEEGAARARLVWTELELGVHELLSLGIAVPYQDLRFEDRLQLTESWGIGDLRLSARVPLHRSRHRLTLRLAWKLPYGEAATSPQDLPLGEGQSDIDLGLQYGRSLGRELSWIGLESGHRWRATNENIGRDPGDEWFWRVEVAHRLPLPGRMSLRLHWDALRGATTRWRDFASEPGRRRVDQIGAGLLLPLREFLVEAGWAVRVAGEAYPAGQEWNLGMSHRFDLRR